MFSSKEEKYVYTHFVGMDRIAVLPDIQPTGYPAILKTGYRIFQTYDILYENSMKMLHFFIKTRASKLMK